jgi:flavin-dependent dehydrogenase
VTGQDAGPRAQHDVVVIGGGPAGAAAAIHLAHCGRSVTLVARPPGRRPHLGETVASGVVTPLAQLGLWEAFIAAGHLPATGTVACWGSTVPHERDSLFDPYGCSWHLDRVRFDAMLLAAAKDAGVDVRFGTVLHGDNGGDGWTIRVAGRRPATLSARWAVDATGRGARIARGQGVERIRCDRLLGLARFYRWADTADTRTVVEATEHGWWYVSPLPGDRAVAVMFTDADLLPRDPVRRAERWDGLLATTRLVRGWLGDASGASPLCTASACSGALATACGRQWLAVGDAAQSRDPLSGQGILTALGSALAAAELLGSGGPGSAALDRYAQCAHAGYQDYLRERSVQYGRETRWALSPFWRRRAGGLTPDGPRRSTG